LIAETAAAAWVGEQTWHGMMAGAERLIDSITDTHKMPRLTSGRTFWQ